MNIWKDSNNSLSWLEQQEKELKKELKKGFEEFFLKGSTAYKISEEGKITHIGGIDPYEENNTGSEESSSKR